MGPVPSVGSSSVTVVKFSDQLKDSLVSDEMIVVETVST